MRGKCALVNEGETNDVSSRYAVESAIPFNQVVFADVRVDRGWSVLRLAMSLPVRLESYRGCIISPYTIALDDIWDTVAFVRAIDSAIPERFVRCVGQFNKSLHEAIELSATVAKRIVDPWQVGSLVKP